MDVHDNWRFFTFASRVSTSFRPELSKTWMFPPFNACASALDTTLAGRVRARPNGFFSTVYSPNSRLPLDSASFTCSGVSSVFTVVKTANVGESGRTMERMVAYGFSSSVISPVEIAIISSLVIPLRADVASTVSVLRTAQRDIPNTHIVSAMSSLRDNLRTAKG